MKAHPALQLFLPKGKTGPWVSFFFYFCEIDMQAVSNVLTALIELKNALDVLEEQVDALPPEQSSVVPALRHWLVLTAPYLRESLTEAESALAYDAVQRDLNALASRQEYDRDHFLDAQWVHL